MRIPLVRISLLVLATPLLQAADVAWELKAGLTAPLGSVRTHPDAGMDGSIGTSFGAAVVWRLRPHDSLRVRLDLAGLGTSASHRIDTGDPNETLTFEPEWSIPEFGVDWRHDWLKGGAGWFVEAGAGFASPKLGLNTHYTAGPGWPTVGSTYTARQDTKPALQIGGGHFFTPRVFASATYHHVFVDKSGSDPFPFDTLTWLDVSVGVRFGGGR
ncbi:hypothetical protein [Mesoterricola sediminis]|uniref:Outer membrane protein beta-barrel domain-containing protein n=1 Tax=Mesoterricola sediminis TaxID=2927980 RepID=A0AA48KHB2_9BACT|nr:hypothetical protein [Mesoterricola sediminis]BDU78203.1 hypothetical protein METESE_31610 [Mesoterricola sediminis]